MSISAVCLVMLALASFTRSSEFAVVGYVPEWRFDGIPFHLIIPHLTHLILFSIETDSDANLVELDRLPSSDKLREIKQLCLESRTKLLVSFGGYGRSNGFPAVSKSGQLRQIFVQNTLQLMSEHQFDGIDLNWEYPSSQPEWIGLFQLIQLFKQTAADNTTLTMAFYPGQEAILASPMAEQYALQQNIDLFLMMSYDNMRSSKPAKHSTYEFAVSTVENAIKGGLTPQKMAMGLPFYARHTMSGDWKTYEEIVRELREKEKIRDEAIRKRNMWKEVYYYNGYNMIAKKTKYAVQSGIGGVMIWENGQDVHGDEAVSLLAAISKTVWKGKEKVHKEEL